MQIDFSPFCSRILERMIVIEYSRNWEVKYHIMTSIQLSAINIVITLLFTVECKDSLRILYGLLITMQKDLENN